MKKTLLLITVLLVLGNVTRGMEPGGHPGPFAVTLLQFYQSTRFKDEGPFVCWPASVGEYSVTAVGSVIVLPVYLGYSVLNWETPNMVAPLPFSYYTFGAFGRFILGFPFYIVKKIIWDLPVNTWKVMTGEIQPDFKFLYHFHTYDLRVDICERQWLRGSMEWGDPKNGNYHVDKGNIFYSYEGHGYRIKLENNILTINGKKYLFSGKINDIRIKGGQVTVNRVPIEPEEDTSASVEAKQDK